jgi:uncharacterized protein YdhG (YjbR/CyaY superfamily)
MEATRFKTVTEYISSFPQPAKTMLKQLRDVIKAAAPQAEEKISYNMPAYMLHGRLIYFAGYKNHIGFYPMASGIETFKKEISKYKWAKGSVQFPLDQPLPLDLVNRIVKFRVKQNLENE